MNQEFVKYGRMLWEAGLVHMTAGNMSVRQGQAIYITRTGSILGRLSSRDIVKVNVGNNRNDKNASLETPVHRAIYKDLPEVQAIVHAHPIYATTLSWDYTVIKPMDSDSLMIKEIPVVTECSYGEGSVCVAAHCPKSLAGHVVALVRGHGAFAVGKTLEQAASRVSMMENQCRLLYLRRLLER